jgi:hypothetical protein
VLSPLSRSIGVLAAVAALATLSGVWAVPAVMSLSTFAFLAVFLIGGAMVTLVTWRNAQATESMAQLLHETEGTSRTRRRA